MTLARSAALEVARYVPESTPTEASSSRHGRGRASTAIASSGGTRLSAPTCTLTAMPSANDDAIRNRRRPESP